MFSAFLVYKNIQNDFGCTVIDNDKEPFIFNLLMIILEKMFRVYRFCR